MAQYFTLSQLCGSFTRMIQTHYNGNYRIVAETLDVNRNKSVGHYYLELVEKDKLTDNIIARIKAIIWERDANRIVSRFEKVTNQKFSTGLEILVTVNVKYHPIYGISLSITDIEPEYTLGDIARKRQELIKRLKSEGIYGKNRTVAIPIPTKVIAVISSPTAAGWGDFRDQLEHNNLGLPFHCMLFPAILQGNRMEESVLSALHRIRNSKIPFDAVVIIRGGGSTADLRYFDSYLLAKEIASIPIPVFTGIGHQRDECLLDHVVAFPLKTPTAVAEKLIEIGRKELEKLIYLKTLLIEVIGETLLKSENKLHLLVLNIPRLISQQIVKENDTLSLLERNIIRANREHTSGHKLRISTYHSKINSAVNYYYAQQNERLAQTSSRLPRLLSQQIDSIKEKLLQQEKLLKVLSPKNTMARGFSIVRKKGKAISNVTTITTGEDVEILFSNGEAKAKITNIYKNN